MPNLKGVFGLKEGKDLLKKLDRDFKRIQDDASDDYAAYDFFVTAEHMSEWARPTSPQGARKAAATTPGDAAALEVTKRLANGAKHFRVTQTPRPTVVGTGTQDGGFQPDAFQQNAFAPLQVQLVVDLTGADAEALGTTITVLDLARRVLACWQKSPDLI